MVELGTPLPLCLGEQTVELGIAGHRNSKPGLVQMKRIVLKAFSAALILASVSAPARAQVVNDVTGTIVRVTSVEEDVLSSQMVGMRVSAWFGGSSSPIVGLWANLGSTFGVSWGNLGGMTLAGGSNTYSSLWTVTLNSGTDLDRILFEGGPSYGRVLFDRSCSNNRDIGESCSQFAGGGDGTTGSDVGNDYDINSTNSRWNPVVATYSNAVALGAASPVGDLFQQVNVDFSEFNDEGPDNSHSPFTFRMDTDLSNVSTVPEPSTYALMAAGLAAIMGFSRRRRRA